MKVDHHQSAFVSMRKTCKPITLPPHCVHPLKLCLLLFNAKMLATIELRFFFSTIFRETFYFFCKYFVFCLRFIMRCVNSTFSWSYWTWIDTAAAAAAAFHFSSFVTADAKCRRKRTKWQSQINTQWTKKQRSNHMARRYRKTTATKQSHIYFYMCHCGTFRCVTLNCIVWCLCGVRAGRNWLENEMLIRNCRKL